jgi:glutathione S-transferase
MVLCRRDCSGLYVIRVKFPPEDSSPFSAPVRVAIYAKGLNIATEPPPGGLLSATILCLILENNTPLPDGGDHLEDKFPERHYGRPGRKPGRGCVCCNALANSRSWPRWSNSPGRPIPRIAIRVVWLTRLVRGLSSVQIYVGDEQFAAGSQLTLADCELAPALFMLPKIAAAYGKPGLLQAYPPIGRYVASSRSRQPDGLFDKQIDRVFRENETCQRIARIKGVGPKADAAGTGDPKEL